MGNAKAVYSELAVQESQPPSLAFWQKLGGGERSGKGQ